MNETLRLRLKEHNKITRKRSKELKKYDGFSGIDWCLSKVEKECITFKTLFEYDEFLTELKNKPEEDKKKLVAFFLSLQKRLKKCDEDIHKLFSEYKEIRFIGDVEYKKAEELINSLFKGEEIKCQI